MPRLSLRGNLRDGTGAEHGERAGGGSGGKARGTGGEWDREERERQAGRQESGRAGDRQGSTLVESTIWR